MNSSDECMCFVVVAKNEINVGRAKEQEQPDREAARRAACLLGAEELETVTVVENDYDKVLVLDAETRT